MDLPGSAIPVFPLLWKPGALWTTGRDSLPLCAPKPSRAVPLMGGALLLLSEGLPRRGNPQVTLVSLRRS